MLLRLIEENMPLDEVVFYDTGMEFEAIYKIRDKVKILLENKGIKFTELKPKCDFCYKMFEKPVNAGKPTEHKGYSWCGGGCDGEPPRNSKLSRNIAKALLNM